MMWCYVLALIYIDPSRRQVQHLTSGSPQGGWLMANVAHTPTSFAVARND